MEASEAVEREPEVALEPVSAEAAFASDDRESLELAAKLGAQPVETDFKKPARTYPIVVDAGLTPAGLSYAVRATEPEGVCQCISFHPGRETPLPLGRMYTLGIRFHVGRCHAAALLPEVLALVEARRLEPARVTTRVVDWDAAADAWLEPAIKLVVRRD